MTRPALVALMLAGRAADALDGGLAQSLPRICPVDEAVRIPSLAQFRDDLLAAVRARDVDALRPLVDPEIMSGESQEFKRGFGAFVEYHRFHDPSSFYWEAFERTLSLGGVVWPGGTEFCAPYYCDRWPWGGEGDDILVIGYDVPAHASPDGASAVGARLSCDVLRTATTEDLSRVGAPQALLDWVGVYVPGGKLGFVRRDQVTDGEERLRIAKKNGVWRLTSVEASRG